MTDIDDLYEPGDREPEPVDWYTPGPLDLDAIDEACCVYANSGDEKAKEKAASFLLGSVQALVAEGRVSRQRIAEFEALPTREEWTVTLRRDITPAQHDPLMRSFDSGDLTAETAAKNGWQLWRQRSSVHPWEPIDLDAPF